MLSSNHREALLDKDSEISSLLEKLRVREAEISRIREEEVQRASFLQNAILTYVQGSPLGSLSPKKWNWILQLINPIFKERNHRRIMVARPGFLIFFEDQRICMASYLELSVKRRWRTCACFRNHLNSCAKTLFNHGSKNSLQDKAIYSRLQPTDNVCSHKFSLTDFGLEFRSKMHITSVIGLFLEKIMLLCDRLF